MVAFELSLGVFLGTQIGMRAFQAGLEPAMPIHQLLVASFNVAEPEGW